VTEQRGTGDHTHRHPTGVSTISEHMRIKHSMNYIDEYVEESLNPL